MSVNIRVAKKEDARAILDIYAPYVDSFMKIVKELRGE